MAQAFSDKQARRIRKSAKLPSQEPDRPDTLDGVISFFLEYREDLRRPTKEKMKLFRAACSNAIALNKKVAALGLKSLTAPLVEELGEFVRLCRGHPLFAAIDTARDHSRDRPEHLATYMLAIDLGNEFKRLFGRNPASTREGPFHRFVEAFLEEAKKNLGRSDAKHIPAAGTVLKRLGKWRRESPLKGQKSLK